MQDEQGFLEAIIKDPDNDGLRLIYADWLDDHSTQKPGDPNYDRAEFIRLQIEAENPETEDTRREIARRAADQIHADYRDKWDTFWRDECKAYPTYKRGFVECIECTGGDFAKHANAMFRASPVTSAIIQFPTSMQLTRIAESEHLGKLKHLNIAYYNLGGSTLATLVSSPQMANITSLTLNGCQIDGQGAMALATSPYLKNLKRLELSHNNIGDYGLAAMAASPHLSNLAELSIANNGISRIGLNALAAAPSLRNLRTLNLQHNTVAVEDAVRLAQSLPSLYKLGLQYTDAYRSRAVEQLLARREFDEVGPGTPP